MGISNVVVGVLAFSLSSTIAFGSVSLTKAGPGVFGEAGYNVIVARVRDIGVDKRYTTDYSATLEPLVTLAGTFDPAQHSELHVRMFASLTGSSFTQAPPAGSVIMAVISLAPLHGDVNNLVMTVGSDHFDFMPDQAGLVVVDGLSDKRVTETIERIRAAMNGRRR